MKKITLLATIISTTVTTALYGPPLSTISSPDATRLIQDIYNEIEESTKYIDPRSDPDNSSVLGDNFKNSVAYQKRELQLKRENLVFRCQALQKQIEALLSQYKDQLKQKKPDPVVDNSRLIRFIEICLGNTIACNDRLIALSRRMEQVEEHPIITLNIRHQSRKEKLLTPEVSENEKDGEPLSSGYSGDDNELR